MSLLFTILFAHACRSTHHKFALQALQHLRGESAECWREMLLHHYSHYLEGAKAPDDDFKDFRNHVLHVREGNWGGAPVAARKWYGNALESFRDEDWSEGAYAAGVLSHYFTDPLQPFHTGSSDAESVVHRAAEWTICRTYDRLIEMVPALGGYPSIELADGDEWLSELIVLNAKEANRHYEAAIAAYDLSKGVDDPLIGYSEEGQETIAPLMARAVIGWARVLERLFQEAGVVPPAMPTSLTTVIAGLRIPKMWLQRRAADAREREIIDAIHEEFQQTGKVEAALPEENRAIRQARAAEKSPKADSAKAALAKPLVAKLGAAPVSVLPVKTSPPTAVHPSRGPRADVVKAREIAPPSEPTIPSAPAAQSIRLKFHLERSSLIEDAPSIGPKTGQRLRLVGVSTVAELLDADPGELSHRLAGHPVSAATIRGWQDQARLVCRIPGLRGHDAQILVACGYRDPESLAASPADVVWAKVEPFSKTSDGRRIVRTGEPPDLAEVRDWVARSRLARAA